MCRICVSLLSLVIWPDMLPIIQINIEPQPGTSGLNNRREATPDRSSSSGSIGLSDNRPPPNSPRNSTPRGSPTRGFLRDSPPPPHNRGQPPTEEANIEDPQIQLENAWTSTLSDMAVDAKNGTLSSRTLTNELVSMNLQFMAQEKGPKPAQQRRLEVNGVSITYLNILTQKLDIGSHFLCSEGGVFR